MAFTEKIKREVRKKSDGRCVICHQPFVEIHHIIPESENGPDIIDNAVALCAYCHDIFGGNPTKRKQLKELREFWYCAVEANRTPKLMEHHHVYEKIKVVPKVEPSKEPMVAVYHVVYEEEDFCKAANDLLDLTRETQKKCPGKRRALYLDIDGHRLEDNAFDSDMWELQFYFILQNLLPYYTEITLPIVKVENPYAQIEDLIPEHFLILDEQITPEELKAYEGSILHTEMTEEEFNQWQKKSKQVKS